MPESLYCEPCREKGRAIMGPVIGPDGTHYCFDHARENKIPTVRSEPLRTHEVARPVEVKIGANAEPRGGISGRPKDQEKRNEVRKMLLAGNYSLRQIGDQLGCSKMTVLRVLREIPLEQLPKCACGKPVRHKGRCVGRTTKPPRSPSGMVHVDELPPKARERVMTQIESHSEVHHQRAVTFGRVEEPQVVSKGNGLKPLKYSTSIAVLENHLATLLDQVVEVKDAIQTLREVERATTEE